MQPYVSENRTSAPQSEQLTNTEHRRT